MSRTVIFAVDLEAGGPNMDENPVVSFGAACVLWDNGSLKLVSTHRFDCWSGSVDDFDASTLKWWESRGLETLEQFRSTDTQEIAFRKFYEAFYSAYVYAKEIGADFIPVTDCAAYDFAWLARLSSKYNKGQRPIPLFVKKTESVFEMLEPVDVAQMTAGLVMGHSRTFSIVNDSTKSSFDNLIKTQGLEGLSRPSWAVGNTHQPDQDACEIAFRYAELLWYQRRPQ